MVPIWDNHLQIIYVPYCLSTVSEGTSKWMIFGWSTMPQTTFFKGARAPGMAPAWIPFKVCREWYLNSNVCIFFWKILLVYACLVVTWYNSIHGKAISHVLSAFWSSVAIQLTSDQIPSGLHQITMFFFLGKSSTSMGASILKRDLFPQGILVEWVHSWISELLIGCWMLFMFKSHMICMY